EWRTLFVWPVFRQSGERYSVRSERLKDEFGHRSTASAEVGFPDALRWRLGEAGERIRHILKLGGMTRLDCALGRHGLMRRAFSVAIYHAHQRQAFCNPLIDQPLLRQPFSRIALCLVGQQALLFLLASPLYASPAATRALWR
ncbi:acyl-CoA dehydrogenase family protein, partial [Salmonella enterica]|uniref:acyl-CoA dehydrogenase family protein n=1 Tax=Salmonella enterica TaxID=28901 RepID=UPI00398C2DA1